MEALASYARQAHVDTLLKLATRIQARAMQRVGELLKEIKPPTRFTRMQAAHEAGLSERQKNTALRVASIPPEEFEAAVESEKPPTETQDGAGPS
jgi:hypothetical protein